jgi:anti-anti-sigma regulatory factor
VSEINVVRVGTQVVVRLGGDLADEHEDRLLAALEEIAALVLTRVVVDCSAAEQITGAGVRFLETVAGRWRVRFLELPPGLGPAVGRTSVRPDPGRRPGSARSA